MKKLLLALMSLVLIFTLTVSGACSFIERTSEPPETPSVINPDGGNSTYTNPENTFVDNSDVAITYRKIVFNASTVNYGATDISDTDEAYKTAYEKVKRSSVAIITDSGAGSGVIVDMDVLNSDDTVADSTDTLYILTCHHMISDKGNVAVYIADENYRFTNEDFIFTGVIGGKIADNSGNAVTLIGGDQNSDIALLKLDLSKKADSGKALSEERKTAIKGYKVRIPNSGYETGVMESVFSIGNPTGTLPGTASCGRVSYLEREIGVDEIGDMLLGQMDVTSNPGNSGGGLYNLYGDLIGITNAGNTEYQNINFYIPCVLSNDSETAKYSQTVNHGFKYVAEMLLSTYGDNNYGCVPGSKQKFGITVVQDADSQGNTYVYVQAVAKGSIAEASGFKANDIIDSMAVGSNEYTKIEKLSESTNFFVNLKVGELLKVKVRRYVYSYNRFGVVIDTKESVIELSIKAQQFWFCFYKV